jgi:hypothetical protein
MRKGAPRLKTMLIQCNPMLAEVSTLPLLEPGVAPIPEGQTANRSSVNSRTGLRPAEVEIEKWRAETGVRNRPRTDRNTGNCRPETGARQPNPRECHDLKAMHERGDYVSTRPDAPKVEIDDEFWQNARVVHAAETVGR